MQGKSTKPLFAILSVAGLLLASIALADDRAASSPADHHPHSKIVVTGQGKVSAKPDIAYVSLGVVVEKSTASEAMEANNAAMSKLFELLNQLGIEERDVQTTNFSISAQYHFPKNAPRQLTGYQATNNIRIKIRKLNDTGLVVDRLVKEGANQVNSISFAVSNPDSLLDGARQEAVANARHKAELYAKAANVPLGSLLNLSESGGVRPVQPMFDRAAMREQAVPVAPGEQELTVTITAEFAIGGK